MKNLSKDQVRSGLVDRRVDDHKGVFGHLLIVAGSRGMSGAAVLAARAALRSGAGLVTLAGPSSVQFLVAAQVPEAMTLGLPESTAGTVRPEAVGKLKAALKDKRFDALALGPGLSTHPDTERFVLLALSSLDLPAVVDADALNVLASEEPQGVRELLRKRSQPCVFTPHPGEMARCLGIERREVKADRARAAERLAREWGGVAVLKGHGTVVSGGARTMLNPTGGSGLAKGGSGDVLTGLIGGLWAQAIASGRVSGDVAFWCAALGVWLHGKAGEAAEKSKTAWACTASDVIDHLPDAFRAL